MSKQRFGGMKYGQCPDGPRTKGMADGGKVKQSKKGNKKTKLKPDVLGDGMAANAGRELRGATRKQRMKDLGLADGGKVKQPMRPPKKGGKPKKIGDGMGSPGGKYTPGAKGTYPKKKGS